MNEAQRLENKRLITEKEEVARRLVGHWSLEMWWSIVRGDPPHKFADYSARRVAVLERACLICLDVARERRPDDPDVWTEESLTRRIAALKAKQTVETTSREEVLQSWEQEMAGKNRRKKDVTAYGRTIHPARPIVKADLPWRD